MAMDITRLTTAITAQMTAQGFVITGEHAIYLTKLATAIATAVITEIITNAKCNGVDSHGDSHTSVGII